jgi:flagellar motor switch protein FliN/FliY
MSGPEALERLGLSTAEACIGVLEMFAPGKVTVGDPEVAADAKAAFAGLRVPAVAMSVSYIDGVTGGNVFIVTLDGAKKLAAAMMGMEEPEDPEAPELSELEESAVSEAMNQMMAMAAGATSSVLGTEVEIGTPETRLFTASDEFVGSYPSTPHAVQTSFSICGEPARLVQLVPNAFVVRMSSALDEMGSEVLGSDASAPLSGGSASSRATAATPSLAGIPVRVWAELGRARMPSAQVVGLPSGAVVELDRQAEEPIDLYVNGSRFATGRLVVVDGTDWAVRIDHVLDNSSVQMESGMEVARWPESW